ncbi:MAG: hypothetical protein COW01_14575 [Bdellovibrionales bacterium CG12_big_fil_rev_8_21_14_0_65_38_15]|nr:MAG: hypothetical protein COW79_10285 [Bdellovibrionales bacterium CG22_combo_CG10-13_8_21_14_all_38_13]PIQ53166.1 MAG: hypothetical protein COW01_14575 [Bdellovibrionales bacterium CG12_big_fil_rev_8_21_14_0_65_38_15]PIR29417.1 MAG: hypothetical protein COV38_10760 [Bdellovibrionales bacterium CG11_big_fil_rev_8_21_14_0_20_38_13]
MNAIEQLKLKKLIQSDLEQLENLFSTSSFVVSTDQTNANSLFEKFLTNKNIVHSHKDKLVFLDLDVFDFIKANYSIRLHDNKSGTWFDIADFENFLSSSAKVPCMGLSLFSKQEKKLYSLYEDEYRWHYYINE